jgi:thiosulfate/3-mercaptopyruvate sulfurtransferase
VQATVGRPSVAEDGYAKNVLVTTEWLADHLGDDNLVVAEVDEDPALYDDGHIPGAVKLHWREDLQDPVERDLVEKNEFEELLGSRGIANDTSVVLYGDKNNWFAAYAYWYLKIYGHEDVRILDGGRQKWIDEGRELTADVSSPGLVSYSATDRDESIRAYRGYVREIIDSAENELVDVRSPQEYSGELIAPPGYEQEGAQRGGHIPKAQSIPWAQAVRDDGTFKSADDLKALYEGKGVSSDKEITAYCRIGERSAHTWFVLRELLGYENVRNYDGSWTEWGNLVDVPIETGS